MERSTGPSRWDRRNAYRNRVGRISVRHMCADGLESQPSPSLGWRKLRPTMSTKSLMSTLAFGIERIDVVHADLARGHVPLVLTRLFVFPDDIGLRLIVGPEILDVHVRVLVADRFVGEEAQRLVHADRPAHLLVDIRLDHLRAPIAMVGADEAAHADVVQQTGEDHLLRQPGLERVGGALQEVIHGGEAVVEIVEQRRLRRHLRQPRVVAHQHVLAGVLRLQRNAAVVADLAVGEVEQKRLGDDALELFFHLMFELVGTFRQCLGLLVDVHGSPWRLLVVGRLELYTESPPAARGDLVRAMLLTRL